MSFRYPIPDNEVKFEKFCLAFLKAHWNNSQLELYGRRGEKQFGVDIFDPNYNLPFQAAQCKLHEADKFIPPKEIREEVQKALTFKPTLDRYAILTTAKASNIAQNEIVKINKKHSEDGLFSVELFQWSKIEDLLDEYPEVADLLLTVQNSRVRIFEERMTTGFETTDSRLSVINTSLEKSSSDSGIDAAQEYLDFHNYQVAQACFEKIRKQRWSDLSGSQKYRVLTGLAQICLVNGEDSQAGKLLIEAKEAHPEYELAWINEAIGYEFRNESATAHSIASGLRESFPNSGKLAACWIRTHEEKDAEKLRIQISSIALEDSEVWMSLAVKAMRLEQFDNVVKYTDAAIKLKESWFSPHLIRGQAILQGQLAEVRSAYWTAQPPCDAEKMGESLRSLDRAVELLRKQNSRHTLADALVHHGLAKSLLGNKAGGDEDFEEAVKIAPDECGILLRYSQYLLDRDDYDLAVKILRRMVQKTGSLEAKHHLASALSFRDKNGDKAESTTLYRDIAFSVLGTPLPRLGLIVENQINQTIQNAFHITINDMIFANNLAGIDDYLSRIPEGTLSEVALKTTKSKQALVREKLEETRTLSKEAIAAVDDSTSNVDLRALAAHLMKMEDYEGALPLWERICPLGEYSSDVRHLIRCAAKIDRQDVILKTARAIRESGIEDPWLFHQELDVLQASGEIDKAISLLQSYLSRNPDDHPTRLRLTIIGLESDRPDLIDTRPESIPDVSVVTAMAGVMATGVLRKTGRTFEAVVYGYELYRRFRDDPYVNMAFCATVFAPDTQPPEIPAFELVSVGSAVSFEQPGKPESWIIIEDSPEPNRPLLEYPPVDPLVIEIMGKRVGDSFVIAQDYLGEKLGTIKQIVPKYVFRAQNIVHNWQFTFREIPWVNIFPTQRVNPDTGEIEFDPTYIQLVADKRFERIKNASEDYKAGELTLHLFADIAGSKDFETYISFALQKDRGLLCWYGPDEETDEAFTALGECEEVVIDLSALATLYLMNADGILRDWKGKIIVSHNTLNEIRECLPPLPKARRSVGRYGRHEGGYFFIQNDTASDDTYRDYLNSFLSLIYEKAVVLGCETLVSLDPEKRQAYSTALGQHGLESILLGSAPGRLLWSDDSIVKAVARGEFGTRCTWTQASVEFGKNAGFLSSDQARTVSAKLIGFNYINTRFTAAVLVEAGKIAEWNPERWPFEQSLEQLSNPDIPVADVGRLAIAIIEELYNSVAFPPLRQSVVIHIAEQLRVRPNGLPLVMAIEKFLPKVFGLNVIHSIEVRNILNSWILEASRRLETCGGGLIIYRGE
jgi:tetratricopeptide (TPR) repeat protein